MSREELAGIAFCFLLNPYKMQKITIGQHTYTRTQIERWGSFSLSELNNVFDNLLAPKRNAVMIKFLNSFAHRFDVNEFEINKIEDILRWKISFLQRHNFTR